MRITFKRRWLAGLAGLLVSGMLTACGGSGDENPTVRFGYIADYNGANLIAIAEDQGLWEKHGLEIDAKVFTNGPLQIQALNAGDLDFGYIGPGAIWLPASGQAKIVAMNTLGGADRVIAQPGITSIEQLKGKKVGIPEGTSGDMILTFALEAAGLSKDDLEIVPMDPATIVSAFSAGSIDAAGFWYPATDTIKESVPDLKELAANSDFPDTEFPTAFVAANDLVSKDSDKLEATLAVLRDAIEYRESHPKETLALTAELIDVPLDQVKADASRSKTLTLAQIDEATENGQVDDWLNGMQDFFVDAGVLDEAADPADFYTGDAWLGAK